LTYRGQTLLHHTQALCFLRRVVGRQPALWNPIVCVFAEQWARAVHSRRADAAGCRGRDVELADLHALWRWQAGQLVCDGRVQSCAFPGDCREIRKLVELAERQRAGAVEAGVGFV
jgi:hypothetical protein